MLRNLSLQFRYKTYLLSKYRNELKDVSGLHSECIVLMANIKLSLFR